MCEELEELYKTERLQHSFDVRKIKEPLILKYKLESYASWRSNVSNDILIMLQVIK